MSGVNCLQPSRTNFTSLVLSICSSSREEEQTWDYRDTGLTLQHVHTSLCLTHPRGGAEIPKSILRYLTRIASKAKEEPRPTAETCGQGELSQWQMDKYLQWNADENQKS